MPVDVHIAHIPSAARLYGAFLLAVLCVLLWLLLGDAFLPRGAGFSLLVLYLAASAAGALVKRLSRRLPPLLGMLLAGLVLRNLPGEPLRSDHALLGHAFAWWSNKLRACALATIMLRAGLGLDLAKLRRMGLATARLAFCPCLAEALTVALLAAALLSMPPAWGGHGRPKAELERAPAPGLGPVHAPASAPVPAPEPAPEPGASLAVRPLAACCPGRLGCEVSGVPSHAGPGGSTRGRHSPAPT